MFPTSRFGSFTAGPWFCSRHGDEWNLEIRRSNITRLIITSSMTSWLSRSAAKIGSSEFLVNHLRICDSVSFGLQRHVVQPSRTLMPIIDSHTHLPEGAQSCQDAAANPRAVQPFWGRRNLDSHVLDGESLHLMQQSFPEALA
jgi:hypothetical protein